MAEQPIKLWKLRMDSTAGFAVSEERSYMIGSRTHFISTSPNGNVLYGPTAIVAGAESIKTGGGFIELPDITQVVPSTQATPLPGKIPAPPLHVGFNLAEDVAFFAAMLI